MYLFIYLFISNHGKTGTNKVRELKKGGIVLPLRIFTSLVLIMNSSKKRVGVSSFFTSFYPLKMNSSHFPNNPIFTCPVEPFHCYSVNFVASEEVLFLSVTVFSAVFRSFF